MNIELVKKKLEGVHDWQEFYLHEVGEMLTCAMEHIAKLEAAEQERVPDVCQTCDGIGIVFGKIGDCICPDCKGKRG